MKKPVKVLITGAAGDLLLPLEASVEETKLRRQL